ncbi:MAG: hypothetical protein NZ520_04975 [bacterium]|nr:hypothetical protein [bacterium]
MIVAEDLPARTLARYRTVKSFIPTYWRGRVSILAKTLSEFESALSPLYLDIALDGMVLYDPAGYMRRRLEQLRRLVRRLGLVRKKRGRDIVWGWERPPRAGWMLRWDEATG